MTELLRLDSRIIRAWLWRVTRDRDCLDDLCQEVYVRLLRINPEAVDGIGSLRGYARGIAHHVALDWLQRRRVSRIDYLADVEDLGLSGREEDPEEIIAGRQQLKLLIEEVQRLPARCREVLILVKIFGHSVREVAGQMGIEESTVKNQLQLAAKRCANALDRPHSRPGLLLLCRLLGRYKCAA